MRYLPRPYEPEPGFSFNISVGQAFSVMITFMIAYVLPTLGINWLGSLFGSQEISGKVAGANTMDGSGYKMNSYQPFGDLIKNLDINANWMTYLGILLMSFAMVAMFYMIWTGRTSSNSNQLKLASN